MTIAYIRTYSNKQQTESQKNAIEQFAKAKKIEIDKWLKDAKNSSKFLLSQKSQIERELKEENATYAELADYYKVSLSGFKRFIRENIPNLPSRRKKKNDTE